MTTTTVDRPQHMVALAKANEVKHGHAALKREVRAGLSIAQAMGDERALGSLTISKLLSAQKGWAATKTRRFLIPLMISENVRVENLTERQRGLIAGELCGHETP
jgi:hypothetical protein